MYGSQKIQCRLISELEGGYRSLLDLYTMGQRIEDDYLTEFTMPTAEHMRVAAEAITELQFNRITELLGDPKRDIYALGGRISDTIATYLTFHLRQARMGVFHIPRDPESWPEYLLQMKPRDIFLITDFCRYQPNLAKLAKQAYTERKAQVILMTDKRLSPANRYASEVLAVPIDTGTTLGSYSAALAVTEAFVTRDAEENWDNTKTRIEA